MSHKPGDRGKTSPWTGKTYEDMDWSYGDMLSSCTTSVEVKMARAKAGEIARTKDGERTYWRGEKPTLDELEANKQRHQTLSINFEGDCICCNRTFAIPSEALSCRHHGVCTGCKLFLDGKWEGVLRYRMPTLEEAMTGPCGWAEGEVLREHLKNRLKVRKRP